MYILLIPTLYDQWIGTLVHVTILLWRSKIAGHAPRYRLNLLWRSKNGTWVNVSSLTMGLHPSCHYLAGGETPFTATYYVN